MLWALSMSTSKCPRKSPPRIPRKWETGALEVLEVLNDGGREGWLWPRASLERVPVAPNEARVR